MVTLDIRSLILNMFKYLLNRYKTIEFQKTRKRKIEVITQLNTLFSL